MLQGFIVVMDLPMMESSSVFKALQPVRSSVRRRGASNVSMSALSMEVMGALSAEMSCAGDVDGGHFLIVWMDGWVCEESYDSYVYGGTFIDDDDVAYQLEVVDGDSQFTPTGAIRLT